MVPQINNIIDFIITIQTTGNAIDFGDIHKFNSFSTEGCSDSHGGLS